MERINADEDLFRRLYGGAPETECFAPGRVNLIGEHTDYNGGHVLPCALTLGVRCLARRREDRALRFYSANFPESGVIARSLEDLTPAGNWTDYPLGVVWAFRQYGHPLEYGADFLFSGDIPEGAGLSSSAAMEVLTATVLRALYGIPVTPQEAALMGQFAENRFIGVNCGIMDQFASALGRAGCAVYLDTATLDFAYAPLALRGVSLWIVNSGVKHSLAASAYNERRRECETALSQLRTAIPARTLCGVGPAEFAAHAAAITDPVCRRRAKHAVYEERRVTDAVTALRDGRLGDFGALMNASHISLRDDFEVSCAELDLLTELAWSVPGVLGARMTGGGFGGCMVALVEAESAERFRETVRREYKTRTGVDAALYAALPGDGARILRHGNSIYFLRAM